MKRSFTTFNKYGKIVKLNHYDNSDHISRKIMNGQTFYEFGMLDYIKNNIPRTGTYIDAGANIGNHTVFFGMFCAKKVYAIEPVPENVEILKANVKDNFLENTVVLPHGVGKIQNERQIVRFNTNMGSCMLEENPNPNETVQNKKKIITGDAVTIKTPEELGLADISDLTLLKIDCEIMSLEVLEAFKDIVLRNKAHVFMEATSEEIKSVEKMLNYKAIRRFNATPTYHFSPK
jgi:protein O-GlcNAc transferase